jgi:hypothetical protein
MQTAKRTVRDAGRSAARERVAKWVRRGACLAFGGLVACTSSYAQQGESPQAESPPAPSSEAATSGEALSASSTADPPCGTPVAPLGTCHPSACTPAFCTRGDIASLPGPLKNRLGTLDCSPHSISPVQARAEAARASELFQYYLLDSKGFQPSVLTTAIAGVNDHAMLTSWGGNCGLTTIGSVRLVVEPKPGLPDDPNNPRAFIDIFTDLRGLFVINNESGWYEGWMIHDLRVAPTMAAVKGRAPFGAITPEDHQMLAEMGTGNNGTAGRFFTVDGKAARFPSPSDHFPDKVANIVPIQLSMGAYNSLQQSDAHSYWEFNYTTNWVHPLYELPFAGGFPDGSATQPADTYRDGEISARQSIVPGNEPASNNRGVREAVTFGDNPDRPRDPDLFDADEGFDSQREFRERFVPSGIAREALLNAFERLASFEPHEHNLTRRLLDGYKAAVALIDTNHDGIISAAEGDIDTASTFCPGHDLACVFLLPRSYDRFAVTREINDGLLAPRFAPSTRGWALSGRAVTGFPVVPASQGRDSDDR